MVTIRSCQPSWYGHSPTQAPQPVQSPESITFSFKVCWLLPRSRVTIYTLQHSRTKHNFSNICNDPGGAILMSPACLALYLSPPQNTTKKASREPSGTPFYERSFRGFFGINARIFKITLSPYFITNFSVFYRWIKDGRYARLHSRPPRHPEEEPEQRGGL